MLIITALLFYFGQDGPKLEVYCSFLLSSLITEAKWELLEEDDYPVQVSYNQVQFALPGKKYRLRDDNRSFFLLFPRYG